MRHYFIIFILLTPILLRAEMHIESLNRLQILPTKSGMVVYIKFTKPLKYFKAFVLNSPSRFVIDFTKAKITKSFQKDVKHYSSPNFIPEIKNIHYGNFTSGTTRLVMTLRKGASIGSYLIEKSTLLIFIQWDAKGQHSITLGKSHTSHKPIESISNTPKKSKITIVIDPGHGGIDPGATSILHYPEKKFTLKFAKKLKYYLIHTYHYHVILTRKTDVYIPLNERYRIAEKYHAKLFISIHGNHSPSSRIRGFSIYTFADRASDNSASILASYENASDILAGISDKNTNSPIADILLTIQRHKTMQDSTAFSNLLVRQVKQVSLSKLLHHPHQFAHFVVLKSPTIPSILLEIGFLSNRIDAKNMYYNSHYINKMNRAISIAISEFIRNYKAT